MTETNPLLGKRVMRLIQHEKGRLTFAAQKLTAELAKRGIDVGHSTAVLCFAQAYTVFEDPSLVDGECGDKEKAK